MDNPVDHPIDLGLVNYVKHPTNPNYVVYRFADIERANSFEKGLDELGIWFEKGTEEKKQRTYTLFGIHKNDFKKTEQLNYDVEARHKKPFIPIKGLRYFLLLFSALVLILAVMGYCEQQKKLSLHNQSDLTLNRSGQMN